MTDYSKKAREFVDQNPDFWSEFCTRASLASRNGRKTFGAKAICEGIRWDFSARTDSEEEYKVNNNYTAYFARLFHEQFPHHDGFFKTRGD
jgi:hypothetical protein